MKKHASALRLKVAPAPRRSLDEYFRNRDQLLELFAALRRPGEAEAWRRR